MDELKIAIDLVNIFLKIYNFDVGETKEGDMSIKIDVHVENMPVWNSLKKKINTLVNFVTEADDRYWNINFIGATNITIPSLRQAPHENCFDNISLLSGGLDSFCGAYVNTRDNARSLYLGYNISNVDTSHINKVKNFILENDSCCISVPPMHTRKIKPTQRTRSLLFFSLASYYAVLNNISKINIYENGIMTLNPSFQTRGTTKTTHPKTIYLFQSLLDEIKLNIKLQHPFLFQTKGELVTSLSSMFKEQIINTRSCSKSIQWIGMSGHSSCGVCVPCLLRKISLAAYDLEQYDLDYAVPYNGEINVPNKKKELYIEEYHSSVNYFIEYMQSIKNKDILSYLDIRGKYYSKLCNEDIDYLEKTNNMFIKFQNEIDIFLKKYCN